MVCLHMLQTSVMKVNKLCVAYPCANTCRSGEWKRDKRHGKGTFYYGDGHTYSGDWYYGKMHGIGTMRYKDGEEYSGSFVDEVLLVILLVMMPCHSHAAGTIEEDGQGSL